MSAAVSARFGRDHIWAGRRPIVESGVGLDQTFTWSASFTSGVKYWLRMKVGEWGRGDGFGVGSGMRRMLYSQDLAADDDVTRRLPVC
jgi:hypothetical protein